MPQLEHIEAIETRLWEATDTLRANSNDASNVHFLPVMGLVFLRHACGRYLAVKDEIDAAKVAAVPRLPFGLPAVNKKDRVGNGNCIWISYFWSYRTERGRAGFVMSSQASGAGGGDQEKLRGAGDMMMAARAGTPSRGRSAAMWTGEASETGRGVEWGIVRAKPQMEALNEGPSRTGP